jgi:2-(1,2-epoxy-1,2-dihydrophenyl)acetyl-CoA isomerase
VGTVLTQADGPVLTVTLNRPEVLNALDDALLDELTGVWLEARRPDVRAVVVTGAGRAFCAGADLGAPVRDPDAIAENTRKRYNGHALALDAVGAPVIAAVNGAAVGAGLSLACAADLRIASDRARFKPGFVAIGAVPDAGASSFVPRLIGPSRAFDWLCSDRMLDAEEALAWGLVNEVVPHDGLLEHAAERAADLAAMPGRGVELTKRLLTGATTRSLADQLELEAQAQTEAVADPARTVARAAVADSIEH